MIHKGSRRWRYPTNLITHYRKNKIQKISIKIYNNTNPSSGDHRSPTRINNFVNCAPISGRLRLLRTDGHPTRPPPIKIIGNRQKPIILLSDLSHRARRKELAASLSSRPRENIRKRKIDSRTPGRLPLESRGIYFTFSLGCHYLDSSWNTNINPFWNSSFC